MHIQRFLFITIIVTLSGCVSDIHRKEANIHYEAALQFEFKKDFLSARDQYGKALVAARLAGADQAAISMLTYNYGRMVGYNCNYDEAEKLLIESVQLEKTLNSLDTKNLTKRWSELARLTFDQQKYTESANWFSQALPELERFDLPKDDPVGFAQYLEDYSKALEKSGNSSQASELRARAFKLRSDNPNTKAKFSPVYYRDICHA